MKRLGRIVMAGLVLGLLLVGWAHAQYPAPLTPVPNGGYYVYPPAQPPTQLIPNGAGGYNIYTPPSAPPIWVQPAMPPSGLGGGLPGAPPPGYQPPVAAGSQMYGQ